MPPPWAVEGKRRRITQFAELMDTALTYISLNVSLCCLPALLHTLKEVSHTTGFITFVYFADSRRAAATLTRHLSIISTRATDFPSSAEQSATLWATLRTVVVAVGMYIHLSLCGLFTCHAWRSKAIEHWRWPSYSQLARSPNVRNEGLRPRAMKSCREVCRVFPHACARVCVSGGR